MSADDFLRNNRGIDDGADLDPEFMRALYDRIVTNEIKMKDEDDDGAAGGGGKGGKAAKDAEEAGGAGGRLQPGRVGGGGLEI